MVSIVRTHRNFIDNRIFKREIYGYPGVANPWVPTLGGVLTSVNSVEYEPYSYPGWRHEIKARRNVSTKLIATKWKYAMENREEFIGYTIHQNPDPPFPATDFRIELKGKFQYGTNPPVESDLESLLAQANNQALMRLNSSILKAQQSIPGLVAAGELGETLRMLRNPAKSLFSGLSDYLGTATKRALRSGKNVRARNRAISNTWLEYSFGWRPLINDINGAAEALAKATVYMAETAEVHGYGESQKTSHPFPNTQFDYADLTLKFTNRFNRQTASVRYHGIVSNNPTDWSSVAKLVGFNPEAFVPAVWNLLPYSFLVDYFTNIGGIISAFCTDTSGVRWLEKGYRTSSSNYQNVQYELKPIIGRYFKPWLYEYRDVFDSLGKSHDIGVKHYYRNRYEESIIPSLEFTIPGLGLKWLNLFALGRTHTAAVNSLR